MYSDDFECSAVESGEGLGEYGHCDGELVDAVPARHRL